jgi:diguanylate cyclase (GGDEF)-like protein
MLLVRTAWQEWDRWEAEVTLRARLAGAFFVLLVGPLLVAGWMLTAFVTRGDAGPGTDGGGVAELSPGEATSMRLAVVADCRHLQATADGLAVTAGVRQQSLVVNPDGAAEPWALCGVAPDPDQGPVAVRGLAARAAVRGARGDLAGYAYAVQPLDDPYLRRLSSVVGRRVTVDPAGSSAVTVDASQPLPLLAGRPSDREAPTVVVVVVGLATAVGAAAWLAWWLSRLATRPLEDLLGAVDRASAGDLESRSRVSGVDETGRLGSGVNRLIGSLQETQRQSVTDALTGLGNLRHLRESLRRESERASRFGRTLGVLALDLDHFKTINDRFGHRAGDDVLVEFAGRIRKVVREVDLAFRQGGEEFVILLPETDVAGSLTAARRIGEAVRDKPFTAAVRRPGGPVRLEPIPITVSIGVAVFPRHALTGAEVLDAADAALYRAKALGRDTFSMASLRLPEPRGSQPAQPARARASAGDTQPAQPARAKASAGDTAAGAASSGGTPPTHSLADG